MGQFDFPRVVKSESVCALVAPMNRAVIVMSSLIAPVLVSAHQCGPIGATVTVEAARGAANKLFGSLVGCGALQATPIDTGSAWEFIALVGFAGEADPNPVVVNKKTGEASWASASYFRCIGRQYVPYFGYKRLLRVAGALC